MIFSQCLSNFSNSQFFKSKYFSTRSLFSIFLLSSNTFKVGCVLSLQVKIYNAFRKYIFVCRWNITGTQYSFISPEVGRFEGEKERIGVGFLVVFFLGGGVGGICWYTRYYAVVKNFRTIALKNTSLRKSPNVMNNLSLSFMVLSFVSSNTVDSL